MLYLDIALITTALLSVAAVLYQSKVHKSHVAEINVMWEARLADVERLYRERLQDTRSDRDKGVIMAEAKGHAAGKAEILTHIQLVGYNADELVDSFLWKSKQRRTLAVVLLEGRPLHVWGDVNKLDVFEIPPELKKALVSFLASAAAGVILGTPIRAAASC